MDRGISVSPDESLSIASIGVVCLFTITLAAIARFLLGSHPFLAVAGVSLAILASSRPRLTGMSIVAIGAATSAIFIFTRTWTSLLAVTVAAGAYR